MPLALCAMLLLGFSEGLQGETPCSSKSTIKLQTDRLHYLPSETVHITGSGFASSCRVTLVINRPDGTSGGDLLFTTDATGGFSYSFVMTGLKGTYTDSVFGKNRALLAGSTFTNGSTVMTDKSDYHPGETVTITGNRWLAGETVALLVRENTGVPDRTFYATVNASGDFVNKDLLITPADIGARFVVTATGQTSGFTARTTFMDSLASDCFRTVASGNWNSTSTWESAPTPGCTVWASATLTPTSAASTITIQSGHTADVTANVTVDQVTVASGGDLEIDTGVILALNHAGTPDLLVNGTVGVTGTLTQQTGTTGSYVEVGGTGRLTVNSGGLINGTGGSLATVSSFQVDSGGQWTINSGGSLSAGGGNGMAVIVNSGGTATWNGPVAIGTTMTLNGTVNASANVTVNSVSNLQIGGTVTMTAGTLAISRGNGGTLGSINSGGSLIFQGSSAFTLGSVGSFSVASGGTIDFGPSTTVSGGASLATVAGANVKIGSTTGVNGNITSGRSFDNGTNWTFDGTAAQVTGTFLPVTVGKLTINNSGPATVTLGAAVVTQTVSGLLTVTSGTFDQGASANLVATGGISIASGATYKNVGTGDLTLGAGVANAGTIQLNAGGVACPSVGADSILIRSSVAGTQRAWSGAGSFDLQNVDVKDQAGTASIQVKSGTDSGNNGSNWTFTGCPTQIRVETAANGSGVVVPAQSVASGSTLTVFSISRDASNNFVANVAADSWSLVSVTGGVVAGDLVAAGDSKSATFTGHLVGTAVIHAVVSGLTSTDSGTITVIAGAATKIRVETLANGSGVVVPAQSVASGSTLTVFSISRDASNNFVANVAADSWSLVSVTGGVVAGDLVAAGDSKSATFTGHLVGTAVIHAVVSGLTSTDSGTITVIAGAATKIRVETLANGSGVVVPAQSVASGSTLTVFSISRDASNNFVANVAADSWSLVSVTGGVVAGDLVAAGDSKSATFTGHVAGTAAIHAAKAGLASTDSGTITVTGGTTADLSIGNTAGAARAFTCSTITYTIVVTNNGPNAVTGATVTDTFPADLTAVTWTCIASGGSSCGAGSGSGNISTTVNLANGGTATLTATGTVAQTTDGTMSNTASVAVPGGVTDPNGSNNSGTVTTSLNTWVNNAAGSDSNEGTSDAPYASIAMAASVIGNSGNVLVQVGNSQAGTPYAANISISGPGLNGTASCKTLFQGITDVNGNEPLIRGTDPTVDAGFDVASNDVDIEHFQIENTLVALMAEPSTTRVVFAHNFVRVPDLAYGTLLYSSSNALVEDNRVEAASSNSFFGVWDYSGSGNTLDGNKVSGHGNAGIRSDLSTGLIVRRNITKGNVIGLHMAGATGPATLYNNTVDGNSYLGIYAESPGGTVTSRNNIVTNNGVGWAWNGTGTVSSNYDDVFGNTSNYSYHGTVAAGGNSISANPVFVQTTDPTLPTYYQLSSGSPCINAGTDVGLPYSGPAPDIGAVEVP
jgi:uncharacterized repeat protein (TIGR01451 family)